VLDKLHKAISSERLSRYLRAANADLKTAIELYELNLRLSQGLFGFLHGYEIALRNSMHDQLTHFYGQPNWYDKAPLDQWHTQKIDEAEERCGPGPVTPSRVVAELTLAFWTGLIATRYEQDLWTPCLRKAFPNLNKPSRSHTHRTLQDIQDLRNRIAHHERILGCKGQLYIGLHSVRRTERFINPEAILKCVCYICNDTAVWLSRAARFDECTSILNSEPAKSLVI
jgi:hypothetical protein